MLHDRNHQAHGEHVHQEQSHSVKHLTASRGAIPSTELKPARPEQRANDPPFPKFTEPRPKGEAASVWSIALATKSFAFSALSTDGVSAESGALTTVVRKGTSTKIVAYSDSALTTPISNPSTANSLGLVGPIYWNDATEAEVTFSVTTADSATNLLQVDYAGGSFSATYVQIGQLTLFEETATGTGAQTIFVLSDVVANSPYQINLTIDGLLQPKSSYAVTTDGTDTTVTFSEAPPLSAVIWFTSATLQALSGAADEDISQGSVTATGATVAVALSTLPDYLKPQQLGTVDGAADDVQISAAITAAFTNSIREVRLDANEYDIASTISIADGSDSQYSTQNSLTIAGLGRPFLRLNSSGSPLEDVGTRLKWTGAAGGTVVKVNGPATGINLRDISINCDGASADAAVGLELVSLNRSDIDGLTIAGATTVGLRLNVIDTDPISGSSGEYDATTDNNVKNLNIYIPASAVGVQWDGYGGRRQLADCALATTANITLSGEQTIDGTLTSASRVLVKDQSTASQNGIYTSGAGAWTRATDADAGSELFYATVYVTGGSTNNAKRYHCGNTTTPTVGSDSITWTLDANTDPVRYSVQNTFLLANLTGSVGMEFQFVDQITFGDVFMSFNGTPDGNARSIKMKGVKVSGSNFPQNIRILHLDSGQNAPIEVDDSVSAPGGGHHFGWNTGFDNQHVLGRKEAKYITMHNVANGDHPAGGWWQHQGPTAGKAFQSFLLNPRMIRQTRGSSGTITNGGHCADGFRFSFDGSITGTWTITALSAGDATSDGHPVYKLTLDITAASGNTFFFLLQRPRVRGLRAKLFAGCPTTLSAYWRQTAGSAVSLTGARYEQYFGSGGSPSATAAATVTTAVGYNTNALSSTWKGLDYILTLASVSGKTFGSNNDDYLNIMWSMPLNAVYTLEMMMPQWELGRGFSCFDQRDPSWDDHMCSLFLRKIGKGMSSTFLTASNTSAASVWTSFSVPMLGTPTVTAVTGSASIVTPGEATFTDGGTTAVSGTLLDPNGVRIAVTPGTTWSGTPTAFRPGLLITDLFLLSCE